MSYLLVYFQVSDRHKAISTPLHLQLTIQVYSTGKMVWEGVSGKKAALLASLDMTKV